MKKGTLIILLSILLIICYFCVRHYFVSNESVITNFSIQKPTDIPQNSLPPTQLPPKEDAPPPEEWKQDIDKLSNEFELPQSDSWSILMESATIVTLERPDEFHKGFKEIRIENKGNASKEQVELLQKNLDEFVTAFVKFDMAQYAKLMISNHQYLRKSFKEYYLEKISEWGYDPNKISDYQLFKEIVDHTDNTASWNGIDFNTSRISFYKSETLPTYRVGTWAGVLSNNIRTYNPSFISEKSLSEIISVKPVLFVDISLVVGRGKEWANEVTPFFLRFWYDEETSTFQFYEASNVKKDNTKRDPTLFIF